MKTCNQCGYKNEDTAEKCVNCESAVFESKYTAVNYLVVALAVLLPFIGAWIILFSKPYGEKIRSFFTIYPVVMAFAFATIPGLNIYAMIAIFVICLAPALVYSITKYSKKK